MLSVLNWGQQRFVDFRQVHSGKKSLFPLPLSVCLSLSLSLSLFPVCLFVCLSLVCVAGTKPAFEFELLQPMNVYEYEPTLCEAWCLRAILFLVLKYKIFKSLKLVFWPLLDKKGVLDYILMKKK